MGFRDDDESSRRFATPPIWVLNWIDTTAVVYGLGHSEEVVARAIGPLDVGGRFVSRNVNVTGTALRMVRRLFPAGAAMRGHALLSAASPPTDTRISKPNVESNLTARAGSIVDDRDGIDLHLHPVRQSDVDGGPCGMGLREH